MLDNGPIKATSGGWAREVTTCGLPIATDIASAHLFVNAGGAREMHWHDSAEWAYESSLSDWLAKAPRHLLANNFGIPEKAVASFGKKRMVIAPSNLPV